MWVKVIKKLIEINENIFFYPRLKRELIKILDKKGVIVDIGSNSGQSIDFFLKISKEFKIIGFEPNINLYEYIQDKYSNYQDILIENKGVSDHSGELKLKINALDLTSSFEELDYNSSYLKTKANVLGIKDVKDIIQREQSVRVTTINDIITDLNIQKIELLKIDVEGHEIKCLKGISAESAKKIKFIQIEQHEDDMYLNKTAFSEIETLLGELGFKEKLKIKHGFGNFFEFIFENQCYSQL
jgi:FkbM family methyltransferase